MFLGLGNHTGAQFSKLQNSGANTLGVTQYLKRKEKQGRREIKQAKRNRTREKNRILCQGSMRAGLLPLVKIQD